MDLEVELVFLHTLRACNVFFDGKKFLRINLVLKTLKENIAHLESVQLFFLLVKYPLGFCLSYIPKKKGLHSYKVCNLFFERLLHTSKVCNA